MKKHDIPTNKKQKSAELKKNDEILLISPANVMSIETNLTKGLCIWKKI